MLAMFKAEFITFIGSLGFSDGIILGACFSLFTLWIIATYRSRKSAWQVVRFIFLRVFYSVYVIPVLFAILFIKTIINFCRPSLSAYESIVPVLGATFDLEAIGEEE